MGTGTLVALIGRWQCCPPGKEQEKELKVEEISIIGPTDAEVCDYLDLLCGHPSRYQIKLNDDDLQKYPLQKKSHSTEYLRTIPHLRLRTPLNALLARLRSECDYQLATYFRSRSFIRVQPPIITSSDCEGAGEVFTVTSNAAPRVASQGLSTLVQDSDIFFRDPKYLTVSSQLHLEAHVNEHPRVWTLSPTFRAERSDTPRHVSEFWMLEAEMRTESLDDIMDLAEDVIKQLVAKLQSTTEAREIFTLNRRDGIESVEAGQEIAGLVAKRWSELSGRKWPRITYAEAMSSLKAAVDTNATAFQYRPTWDDGLQLEHEKYIAATFGQGNPVFISHYPQRLKPFYMLPSNAGALGGSDDRPTAACFDLLLPDGCEVVGGSLREHRLDNLNRAMERFGLNQKRTQNTECKDTRHISHKQGNLDWYADLRRYGSVPHGGFGMGFDRLLGYLSGIASIKDVVPWPRYYGRCDC